MKYSILGILLFAVALTHAQVDSDQALENTQNDSALVETVTKEAPADTLIAEEVSAEPERTPEGYRIIRIIVEDTKQYKDSVTKVEKDRIEAEKPTIPFRFQVGLLASIGAKEFFGKDKYAYYDRDRTSGSIEPVTLFYGYPLNIGLLATIPLTEATFAIKVGALYEFTYLIHNENFFLKTEHSAKSPWFEENNRDPEHGNITQMRVSFPLLFALKGRTIPAMLDVGSKISIPIKDEYKSVDFIDEKSRTPVDVAFLFGGTFIINKYFSLIAHFEVQTQDVYEDEVFVGVSNIMLIGMHAGLVFTPF